MGYADGIGFLLDIFPFVFLQCWYFLFEFLADKNCIFVFTF